MYNFMKVVWFKNCFNRLYLLFK